jgi:hypothetical protein
MLQQLACCFLSLSLVHTALYPEAETRALQHPGPGAQRLDPPLESEAPGAASQHFPPGGASQRKVGPVPADQQQTTADVREQVPGRQEVPDLSLYCQDHGPLYSHSLLSSPLALALELALLPCVSVPKFHVTFHEAPILSCIPVSTIPSSLDSHMVGGPHKVS